MYYVNSCARNCPRWGWGGVRGRGNNKYTFSVVPIAREKFKAVKGH